MFIVSMVISGYKFFRVFNERITADDCTRLLLKEELQMKKSGVILIIFLICAAAVGGCQRYIRKPDHTVPTQAAVPAAVPAKPKPSFEDRIAELGRLSEKSFLSSAVPEEDYGYYDWKDGITQTLCEILVYEEATGDDWADNVDQGQSQSLNRCLELKLSDWFQAGNDSLRMVWVGLNRGEYEAFVLVQRKSEVGLSAEKLNQDWKYGRLNQGGFYYDNGNLYAVCMGKDSAWNIKYDITKYLPGVGTWETILSENLSTYYEEGTLEKAAAGFQIRPGTYEEEGLGIYIKDIRFGKLGVSVINQPREYESIFEDSLSYGLLLGLSSPEGIRTLWIRKDQGRLRCKEIPGAALNWKDDGIVSIGSYQYRHQKISTIEDLETFEDFDWRLSVNLPLQEKEHFLDDRKRELQDSGWRSIIEEVKYIGNGWVSKSCYDYYHSQGTMGDSELTFYLNQDETVAAETEPFDVLKECRVSTAKIAAQITEYKEMYESVAVEKDAKLEEEGYYSEEIVKEGQVFLQRESGRVCLMVPVFHYYTRQNGSRYLQDYKAVRLEDKLPEALTGYDTLCMTFEEIQKQIPLARDAVSSPAGDLLAVRTGSGVLQIHGGEALDLESANLMLPIGRDEKIIMSCWVPAEDIGKVNLSLEDTALTEPVFENGIDMGEYRW